MPPEAARILTALRAAGDDLYAVLDSARDPRILPLLRNAAQPHRCLFQGDTERRLEQVAPYLVMLKPREGDGLLRELLVSGWGHAWGVYLTSRHDTSELHQHLAKLLRVRLPGGKRAYLRFYDPRVMRSLIPLLDPSQRRTFFAKVDAFLFEDEAGEQVLSVRAETRPIG